MNYGTVIRTCWRSRTGIVNLRDGTISASDPSHYNTHCAAVEYDPMQESERWNSYLERVHPSPEIRHELQLLAGYCATGETREQVFFVQVGDGSNGKSTFQQTVTETLGTYATAASLVLVDARADKREASHALADLAGKRLAIASELEEGTPLATALIKRLTGEETISARRLYQNSFCFRPTCKLLIDTNHLPRVSDTTYSYQRRVRITEWAETITREEVESGGRLLRAHLREELTGVLTWIVQGSVAYYREGLPENAVAKRTKESFCASCDTLQEFIDTELEVCLDGELQSSLALNMFQRFLARRGRAEKPGSHSFSKEMESKGFHRAKDSSGCIVWKGLRARLDLPSDPNPEWREESFDGGGFAGPDGIAQAAATGQHSTSGGAR